jgi:hypothetical protein
MQAQMNSDAQQKNDLVSVEEQKDEDHPMLDILDKNQESLPVQELASIQD